MYVLTFYLTACIYSLFLYYKLLLYNYKANKYLPSVIPLFRPTAFYGQSFKKETSSSRHLVFCLPRSHFLPFDIFWVVTSAFCCSDMRQMSPDQIHFSPAAVRPTSVICVLKWSIKFLIRSVNSHVCKTRASCNRRYCITSWHHLNWNKMNSDIFRLRMNYFHSIAMFRIVYKITDIYWIAELRSWRLRVDSLIFWNIKPSLNLEGKLPR